MLKSSGKSVETTLRRILSLALIAMTASTSAEAADPDQSVVDTMSCSIQLSIASSPNNYLIAVVEHTARVQCDGSSCIEILKVLKVIASRMPDGLSGSAEVRLRVLDKKLLAQMSGNEQRTYRTYKELGIYVPEPGADTTVYYQAGAFSPVSEQLEAVFVEVAKTALASPGGAPACAKAFAKSSDTLEK